MVTLANNHFLDLGAAGAVATIRALEREGIAYTGVTGMTANTRPFTIATRGGVIGVLGYAACAHPLARNAQINIAAADPQIMSTQIRSLRAAVDVLIVLLHAGVEYCDYPHPEDRERCKLAVESGADLVVCHHPHVVQGIEALNGGIVFHSLGNFLIDVFAQQRPQAARTFALRVHMARGAIHRLVIEPFELNDEFQPVPMNGPQCLQFLSHVHSLSTALHQEGSAKRCLAIARRRRICARVEHALEMVGRVGITRTLRYYAGRAVWGRRAAAKQGCFRSQHCSTLNCEKPL